MPSTDRRASSQSSHRVCPVLAGRIGMKILPHTSVRGTHAAYKLIPSAHVGYHRPQATAVRSGQPSVRLTQAAFGGDQHQQLLEAAGAALQPQSNTPEDTFCLKFRDAYKNVMLFICPLTSLSAQCTLLYWMSDALRRALVWHASGLCPHGAGPALWTRHALAKYFLQRFGAAASSLAASLLLLLPASAEPTVVR